MEAKNKVRLGLAAIAGVLLVFMVLAIDFEKFEWKDLLGPLAMVLLVLAMILSIRQSKNE